MTILTDLMDSTRQAGIGAEGTTLTELHTAVNRYCLSLTKSGWDAEDLAQDTWLKAIKKLNEAGHANPEAYLLTIAKRTWIDQARRKAVLTRILKRQERQPFALSDNGSFEIETVFQSLMKHMPPLQRTVFLLRDVLGYSISEAADMLKTTEGAVKAAHHRARQSLKVVKEELERGDLPLPEDDSLKSVLRAIATAYEVGDVAALVRISLYGQVEAEPVAAIGTLMRKGRKKVRYDGIQSALQMAA